MTKAEQLTQEYGFTREGLAGKGIDNTPEGSAAYLLYYEDTFWTPLLNQIAEAEKIVAGSTSNRSKAYQKADQALDPKHGLVATLERSREIMELNYLDFEQTMKRLGISKQQPKPDPAMFQVWKHSGDGMELIHYTQNRNEALAAYKQSSGREFTGWAEVIGDAMFTIIEIEAA